MTTASDRAWAILLARTVLGVVFFVAGFYKVFLWGPLEHARTFFTGPYADTFLPMWSLWLTGTTIPFVELIAGGLVLMGVWTRPALFALAGVLVTVAFGHLLLEPAPSIIPFILTRSTLLLIVLLAPAIPETKKDHGTWTPEFVNHAAARFLTRTMIGFVYLFEGVHILTGAGAAEFGRSLLAATDLARVVPASAVVAIGTITPFVQVVLGTLLLVGLWTRPALRCAVLLLMAVTIAYGLNGLLQPMGATAMNITVVNFYILPRAALVMVTLFLPADDDVLSVDALLDGRAWRLVAGARREPQDV
jgi:uncharacterized membrane protein YphA (DoxX/SURF4 family)